MSKEEVVPKFFTEEEIEYQQKQETKTLSGLKSKPQNLIWNLRPPESIKCISIMMNK